MPVKEKEYNVFVGYDDREKEFYDLCQYTLKTSSEFKVNVYPLNHLELRQKGYFTRPWQVDGITGQYIDLVDNKPFSTQFSHSRFLTPLIAKEMGLKGKVMFVDLDFLFVDDVANLFGEIELRDRKSIYVVKHEYTPNNSKKMDNKEQVKYDKKLWSSLMVFDLEHLETEALTKNLINTADGRFLHQFKWLKDDNSIGFINESWNYIPEHSDKRIHEGDISAIHFTEGAPFMKGYENCAMSEVYYDVKEEFIAEQYLDLIERPELTVVGS